LGIFLRWIEKSFKRNVRNLLVANVPDFDRFERCLPLSTIEQAYKTAWIMFGKDYHDKPPAVYQQKCVDAAEYIIEHHKTAAKLFFGISEDESVIGSG
jgi:hypothetical protein